MKVICVRQQTVECLRLSPLLYQHRAKGRTLWLIDYKIKQSYPCTWNSQKTWKWHEPAFCRMFRHLQNYWRLFLTFYSWGCMLHLNLGTELCCSSRVNTWLVVHFNFNDNKNYNHRPGDIGMTISGGEVEGVETLFVGQVCLTAEVTEVLYWGQ